MYTEKVYGKFSKHMDYHSRLSTLRLSTSNVESSLETLFRSISSKIGSAPGVKLSPIPFLVTFDCVKQLPCALVDFLLIMGVDYLHLQDLDFADDIANLSSTPTHLQENRRSQFKCQENETDHEQKEIRSYVCQL